MAAKNAINSERIYRNSRERSGGRSRCGYFYGLLIRIKIKNCKG